MNSSIHVENLSLSYYVREMGRLSLKEWVFGGFRQGKRIEVKALQGVSFHLAEGQRLGVLGHNGAGKSTLLKVLAGIYKPSGGDCRVAGRVASLFDLSLGFEPDATGWENIYYRGYLQKETPASLRGKVQAIAAFSELGPALNRPIRTYSTGMAVRLAFSIATAIEPEILLMDEVLGAGDLSFMTKARERIQCLIQRARMMVLVSHDLEALVKLCDYGLWLDRGEVRQFGPIQAVVPAYRNSVQGMARAIAA
jgi:ABC-type polysaccharide/polyol phosphate transport system ATPase subunit